MSDQENLIVKGLDIKNILYGLCGIGGGILIVIIFLSFNITLRIKSLVLPQWTVFILGGIFIIVGVFLIINSLNSEKCVKCNVVLKDGMAYFPMSAEMELVEIVKKEEYVKINDLKKINENPKIEMGIGWCSDCLNIGKVQIAKYENNEYEHIIPEKIISGKNVKILADIVKAHIEWRGEDDD